MSSEPTDPATPDAPTDVPTQLPRLSVEEILLIDDLPTKIVELPAWNTTMQIKALGRDTIKGIYRRNTDDKTNKTDTDAVEMMLICNGSVDPKITPPLFAKLKNKNAGPITILLDAILGLSGWDKEALKRAEEFFRD